MLVGLLIWTVRSGVCRAEYAERSSPSVDGVVHLTLIFKHGLHAPLDRLASLNQKWLCDGDWILSAGGVEEALPRREFRITEIAQQSLMGGGCRGGQLLAEGVDAIKALALHIRATYSGFFPARREEVAFRATYTPQALESAAVFAAGLAGDHADVFVSNEELETLVPNPYLCPSFGEQLDAAWRNASDSPEILRWADLATLHECVGMPTHSQNATAARSRFLDFWRPLLPQRTVLEDVVLGMREFLTGAERRRATVIVAHTLTLLAVSRALNLTEEWPAPASYMAFELTEDAVRVVVNGAPGPSFSHSQFEAMATEAVARQQCHLAWPFPEPRKDLPGLSLLSQLFS